VSTRVLKKGNCRLPQHLGDNWRKVLQISRRVSSDFSSMATSLVSAAMSRSTKGILDDEEKDWPSQHLQISRLVAIEEDPACT
jgi:hypothetical protein